MSKKPSHIDKTKGDFYKSNDFFYKVVESLEDYAVFTVDTNRNINSWNKGAEKLLGYTEEEIIGKSADILFTSEDRKNKAPETEQKTAEKKGEATDERWHVKKNGMKFWASGKLFPLRDDDKQIQGFTKIMRDRTAQKTAEEKLYLTEEFNRRLQESATASVKVLDYEGTILSINKNGLKIMEIDDFSKLQGKKWTIFWKAEHKKSATQALKSAQNGNIGHFIGYKQTIKGTDKWWDVIVTPIFNEQGKVYRLLAVSRDITKQKEVEEERKKLLEELKLEKAKLTEIFEQAPAFMALVQGKDYVFEMANKAYYQLVGHRDIIGKKVTEAIPEIKEQGFIEIMDAVLKTGKPFKGEEIIARLQRSPQGQLEDRYLNLVYQPVRDSNNKPIGIVAHGYDVTEQVHSRKQIEELLLEQERDKGRIAFAQEAGKIGTFEWDVQNGISTWTKEFEALYGFPNGGFESGTTESWLKYVHPGDRKRVLAETNKCLKEKKQKDFSVEYRVVWPDHSVHYLVTRAKIIRDQKGKPLHFIGVNIDITERKLIENNLHFLSQVSKVLSSSLDYKTTLSNISKLAVSEIADWCSITMRTGNGLETLAVAHIDPKKVKWAIELDKTNPPSLDKKTGVAEVFRTGKAAFYPYISDEMIVQTAENEEELALIRKLQLTSVMMVPIIVNKKTEGVISFISSESRRQYTKADLIVAEEVASRASLAIQNSLLYQSAQENEMKFKSFVDSNIVGVFTADKKGTITSCNEGFMRLIGYTRKDIEDKKINRWAITPKEYQAADKKAMQELLQKNSTVPWEKEYIKRDGSQVPVIVGSTLINKATGENITIVLDITERKRLEQRKDEFIGIASHELKTPLTSIKGYTQILERIIQQMSDERLKLYLKKTNIYINRLDSLISDLLDVSRIQAGKLQFNMSQFDIYTLVQDSIEAIQPTSTKHKIVCDNCIHQKIYGDMHRLEQVLMNLLSNAVKYSPEAKKVNVHIIKHNNEIRIEVQDFGIGISKKNQSKLFERFYRVEKTATQFSGLGIGLYISAEIIVRHGGSIWVESTEGKGSKFIFTLPIKKKKTK